MPTDEEIAESERKAREHRDREEEFRIRRGEQAKRLLEDELLAETLDIMERAYTKGLQQCNPNDMEGLRSAAMHRKVLEDFRLALRHHLETGMMVSIQRDSRLQVEAEERES